MERSMSKVKRILRSFSFAVKGIAHAVRSERNMKIHLIIATLSIVLGFVLRLNYIEWVLILILAGLVLAFECLNTAFEAIVDRYSSEINPLSRIAKDTAAGAVLITAILAFIAGLIIYLHALFRLLG